MKLFRIFGLIIIGFSLFQLNCAQGPKINVWYGDEQHFGSNGQPQEWINILGRVESQDSVVSLQYSLNQCEPLPLSMGPDGHRLAKPGDFNVEIDYSDLMKGRNTVTIIAVDSTENVREETVTVFYHAVTTCPLPYTIDWSKVDNIQEVAQIVDGRWQLQENGVRVLEPYYDRVLAFGDQSWTDYVVTTSVTFHGMRVPVPGRDAGSGVIHAAIAVRWPGHDQDGNQPRIKWYPLGSTAEFRVNPELQDCSWRILGGGSKVVEEKSKRDIQLDVPYFMQHRVETLTDSTTQYSVKLWRQGEPEPEMWDLQAVEGPDDVQNGGALILAHYTDATFGNVQVRPIP